MIFILDKPVVSQEFFNHAKLTNTPVVWIDHHPLAQEIENIHYFNPLLNKQSTNEPVSYWCWKITKENYPHIKESNQKIKWIIPVTANGESTLTYTIRYNHC